MRISKFTAPNEERASGFGFQVELLKKHPPRVNILNITFGFAVIGYPLAQPVVLSLLVCLLAVAPHLGVRLDVAGDTQQFDVGAPIVAKPLHLSQRLSAFNGYDVVAINAWSDVPVW
jgi:hypothetical protein